MPFSSRPKIAPSVIRPPTPEVGAKVEIIGEQGTYLVVRVDPKRYLADLMLMGKLTKIETGVHYSCIRILPDPRTTSHGLSWRRLVLESTDEVS